MPDPAGDIVTLEGVTVNYGKQRALAGVTTSFHAGAIGLLGVAILVVIAHRTGIAWTHGRTL